MEFQDVFSPQITTADLGTFLEGSKNQITWKLWEESSLMDMYENLGWICQKIVLSVWGMVIVASKTERLCESFAPRGLGQDLSGLICFELGCVKTHHLVMNRNQK